MFQRGFKSWCEQVAIQRRKELDIPPTDPLPSHHLAQHLNVLVWRAEEVPNVDSAHLQVLLQDDPESWSAITLVVGPQPLIILNTAHSIARQSSDLMHELAHLIIGHEPAKVFVGESGTLMLNSFSKQQEDEANWLAGCLLLPREALLAIRRRRISDAEAQTRYGVSPQMFQYRINVSGIESQLKRAARYRRLS